MSYKIYFGGEYTEHWEEDGHLTVVYSERPYVEAEEIDGKWIPSGGDFAITERLNKAEPNNLAYRYFIAAAEIRKYSGDNYRLTEHTFKDAAAFPELLRFLLDEWNYGFDDAIRLCARCCVNLDIDMLDSSEYALYQPRTAALIDVARDAKDKVPVLLHDSSNVKNRFPSGAVRSGEAVKLTVKHVFGVIDSVTLTIRGEYYYSEVLTNREGEYYTAEFRTPSYPAALEYVFCIEAGDNVYWLHPEENGHIGTVSSSNGNGFRLTVYKADFNTPEWFRHCVMYQAFPDRFAFDKSDTFKNGIEYHRSIGQTPDVHAGLEEPVKYLPRENEAEYEPDDFYGGNFKGIIKKLPYLKKLGVSCLYMNPIFEARSNHRYDTADYLRPDPILGTEDDFKELASAADELGIRIILDGVFSHTGADSVYFNKYGHYSSIGAYQGAESPYYNWYDFKRFPDEYRSWWGFKELPEVEETRSDWQRFIITGENSVVKTWLRKGAAGWRLDVADELPDNVLAMIRDAAKSVSKDAPIIGEVWEDAVTKISYGLSRNYALGYSLDSVMNYPLRRAVLDFAHGRTDAYDLCNFLMSQQQNYPKPMYYSLMNLLGSHDVERLITSLSTDMDIRALSREDQLKFEFEPDAVSKALELEKLCAVIQFSLPGVPSIYYGDEQGMAGVCDPFNRAPFKESECGLFEFYSSIAAERNSFPEMQTGEALFVPYSKDSFSILRYISCGRDAFGCRAENGASVVAVNRGNEKMTVKVDCSVIGADTACITVPAMSTLTLKLK